MLSSPPSSPSSIINHCHWIIALIYALVSRTYALYLACTHVLKRALTHSFTRTRTQWEWQDQKGSSRNGSSSGGGGGATNKKYRGCNALVHPVPPWHTARTAHSAQIARFSQSSLQYSLGNECTVCQCRANIARTHPCPIPSHMPCTTIPCIISYTIPCIALVLFEQTTRHITPPLSEQTTNVTSPLRYLSKPHVISPLRYLSKPHVALPRSFLYRTCLPQSRTLSA